MFRAEYELTQGHQLCIDTHKVARLFLEVNVEVNSRNEKGSIPSHLASAGYQEGNPDIGFF